MHSTNIVLNMSDYTSTKLNLLWRNMHDHTNEGQMTSYKSIASCTVDLDLGLTAVGIPTDRGFRANHRNIFIKMSFWSPHRDPAERSNHSLSEQLTSTTKSETHTHKKPIHSGEDLSEAVNLEQVIESAVVLLGLTENKRAQ